MFRNFSFALFKKASSNYKTLSELLDKKDRKAADEFFDSLTEKEQQEVLIESMDHASADSNTNELINEFTENHLRHN